MDETEKNAKELGYVEDMWGRRRRLPDIQLPKFTIVDKNSASTFNPILGCKSIISYESDKVAYYRKLLEGKKTREDIVKIQGRASSIDHISIRDNGGFIAQAQRQCVNSRIQGGAATMSKIAMIHIYKDKILRDLGFKLQIAIHDEVIGECPINNAEKAAKRLVEIMVNCAKDVVVCPMKCDPTIETYWYESDYKSAIKEEYELLLKSNSDTDSFDKIKNNHKESTLDELKEIIYGNS